MDPSGLSSEPSRAIVSSMQPQPLLVQIRRPGLLQDVRTLPPNHTVSPRRTRQCGPRVRKFSGAQSVARLDGLDGVPERLGQYTLPDPADKLADQVAARVLALAHDG